MENKQLYYVHVENKGFLNLIKGTDDKFFDDREETQFSQTKFTEEELRSFGESYWDHAAKVEEI